MFIASVVDIPKALKIPSTSAFNSFSVRAFIIAVLAMFHLTAFSLLYDNRNTKTKPFLFWEVSNLLGC
jgi:hypothetical protein